MRILTFFILLLPTTTVCAQTLPDWKPQQRSLRPQSGTSTDLPSLEDLISTEEDLAAPASIEAREIDPGWWQPMIASSLRRDSSSVPVTLDDILSRTLKYSKQIKVFAELPMIRKTAVVEADAAFDWSAFLDSRWDDTSEPVGNSLTAGPGITRFKDHNLSFSAGARKRTRNGGQLELSQRFGIQDNNSTFFIPNQQGSSRLVLSYTHPLLRGSGEHYNRGLICLADLDKKIADDEYLRQLQSHLLEVTRSYWALYLERGVLLQKMYTYYRARQTVGRLESRRNIDAAESQIRSAQAALKSRRSDLLRAKMAVKNAESRLRSLVNDPALGAFDTAEVIPSDTPMFQTFPVDMQGALAESLQYRPEISQSLRQIKAACLRNNMSKNELMPVLNLVTETYVAGLDANRDIGGAWNNQFNVGAPSYSIGLQFEVPLNNRAARARHIRRCHELRQVRQQYETTLETIHLEVEVAVRELMTSQQELLAKEEAMQARVEQLKYLKARWERLPGENATAAQTLENLLTAQDRLASAEYDYLQSQMTFNLGITNLKRATGTLLQHEHVSVGNSSIRGLSTRLATRPTPAATHEIPPEATGAVRALSPE